MSNKPITMKITDKDLRKSMESIRKNGGALLDACLNEVNKATMNTGADAQQNIKDNGSIATSRLINSISNRFNKTTGTGTITVNVLYAEAVEFGRKAGGMPPIAPILLWVRKKGLAQTTHAGKGGKRIKDKRDDNMREEELRIAWGVAKMIERFGTEAKPFLIPAWKINAKKLIKNLKRVLRDSDKHMKF